MVLLVDKLTDWGGAERFTAGLACELAERGIEVWACSTRGADPSVIRTLERAGVRQLDLGRSGKADVHRFAPLVRLLRRERVDVVHAHGLGSNVWGTIFARTCGVPVVIAQEHTWSYSGQPLRILLDRHLVGRFATRFVAVSRLDAWRMVAIERVPAGKVLRIPAAHIPRPPSEPPQLRAELGLDPGTPLVGSVAVLRSQKALKVLIAAHARILERVPGAHLVLAGDGDQRPGLERCAAELGLSERVHFLGMRADVDGILRELDVAAMSSDWEGTPLSAYECFANGTPLVATNVGGLPEIVENGVTGVLVPPRDPTALANAIAGLLLDPTVRSRLAAAAAERLDEFSIETVAARFADLYANLAPAATR